MDWKDTTPKLFLEADTCDRSRVTASHPGWDAQDSRRLINDHKVQIFEDNGEVHIDISRFDSGKLFCIKFGQTVKFSDTWRPFLILSL
jgi:hypothetical protein